MSIEHTMSATNQRLTRGYLNTNAATSRKEKTRNNRIRNHINESRRNDQLRKISILSFTCEVLSVGAVLGTVTEQRSMKDQLYNFQHKAK